MEKIKKGSKVRVLSDNDFYKKGDVLKVIEVDTQDKEGLPYLCIKDRESSSTWLRPDEIELIPPKEKAFSTMTSKHIIVSPELMDQPIAASIKSELPKEPKPPLGLKPKHIHNQERQLEIIEAMLRYTVAHKPIPIDWVTELATYCEQMKQENIHHWKPSDKREDIIDKTVVQQGTCCPSPAIYNDITADINGVMVCRNCGRIHTSD